MAKCRIGTAKFFTLLLLLYRTLANGDGTIKNKDSIVEFDIAGSTLTRGAASISASFNIGATDYYNGKTEE